MKAWLGVLFTAAEIFSVVAATPGLIGTKQTITESPNSFGGRPVLFEPSFLTLSISAKSSEHEANQMSIREFLFFATIVVVPIAIALGIALRERIPMERRARSLLLQFPDAERTSIYLPFRSAWPSVKRREMELKIGEMENAGWTFLRGAEANPFRTLRSWGGGMNLHFIRRTASESRTPDIVG